MIKSIEKLIDIVANYKTSVIEYHEERERLQRQYADGQIATVNFDSSLKNLDVSMERKAEEYKQQYKTAFQPAVEAVRHDISNPKFAFDTGFRNVIETIKNSDGVYDLEAEVLRGMIAPYLEDYAARKLIAATLDKYTALKSSFFDIHTVNPLYALQSLAGQEEIEFGSWTSNPGSAFYNNNGLRMKLEALLALANGETADIPKTSFIF